MKAIWAYREMFKGKGSEFSLNGLQLFTGIASVLSVQKFLPEVTRTIYVDKGTFNFLERSELLDLWDEVFLVDFDKVLENYAPFFAYPKIWAYTQQDSPFLLLDLDFILLRDPLRDLDLTRNYGIHYKTFPDIFPDEKKYDPSRANAEEAISYWKQKQLPELTHTFVDFDHYFFGGFLYWGDPKVANSVGNKMFEIGLEAEQIERPFRFKWHYYEEAILYQTTKFFGSELRSMPETGVGYHMPTLGSIHDINYFEDQVYSVLGLDIPSMYPKLDFYKRYRIGSENETRKTIL